MRTVNTILLMSTLLAACYEGRDDSAFPGLIVVPTDPGGSDSTDETTTTGGDESSGGESSSTAANGTTGTPEDPGESDKLAPCKLCGCHRWSAVVAADSDAESVTLTALPDGGVVVSAVSSSTLTLHRFGADGEALWSRVFPGQGVDARIVPIGGEFMVLAGTLRGSLALNAEPSGNLQSAGGDDGFAALLSDFGEGGMVWGARFGDMSDQRVSDVAVTGCEAGLVDGCRLHLAGVHTGDLGLGAGVPESDEQVFHADLDAVHWEPSKATVWRSATQLSSSDELPSLAVSGDGGVTMIATVRDASDPGDVIARRLGPDGQEVWSLRFVAPGQQRATAATYTGDWLWLAGYVHAVTDLGAGAFGVDGQQTAFLAALDPDGEFMFNRPVGARLPTRQALAANAGRLTVTGYASDDVDLGGGLMTFRGGRDVMLARYKETGEYMCGALYGDVEPQEGLAVSGLGDRTFVLARVQGAIDFGGGWQANDATTLILAAFSG